VNIKEMKKALEYAISKSEDPKEIKKNMEDYFSKKRGDRRYKFKWRAICGNYKYTFSGLFEYYGKTYYFDKIGSKIELKYHNR
jgi:hypothetical protein